MTKRVQELVSSDPNYIRKLSVAINQLGDTSDTLSGRKVSVLSQSPAPSPGEDEGLLWVAMGSGTLNGTTYAKGDLMFTANSGGVQKTIRIINWGMFS